MDTAPVEAPVPAEGRAARSDLLDYWRSIHRNRRWILGAAGLFAAVAVGRAVLEPPTYTATPSGGTSARLPWWAASGP